MSFWAGLAKAKGAGKKVIRYIEPLSYGGGARDNISANIFPGGEGTGDLVVYIPELTKVDFALCQTLSCAARESGFANPLTTNYSGNTFGLGFVGVLSGFYGGRTTSGLDVSGVLLMNAFVIGEMRQEVP